MPPTPLADPAQAAQPAVSFAHLAGVTTALASGTVPAPGGAPAQSAEEDDADMKKKADDDARRAKRDRRAKKAKKRDEDDNGDDDPDPDDESEDGDKDEDEEEDMKASGVTGRARARERRRCAAIFLSPHAAGAAHLAAHFAFNTRMTRGQAIQALAASVAAMGSRKPGLDARMDRAAIPVVGSGAGGAAMTPGQSILASLAKARGKKAA